MSVNTSLLREMIEAIVASETSLLEALPNSSSSSHSLDNPLLGTDQAYSSRRSRNKLPINPGDMNPEDFEKFLRNLVKRRYGRATLSRKDIEWLDRLTRWMNYIPGGHRYRRGLAKYLRSKSDKVNRDPFRDFRRYQYQHTDMDEETKLDEDVLDEDMEQAGLFFHGSSARLDPGDLVLPPSKTGKVSEKGRKKNLDVVFFTKDPRSALIYAGRAAQSLGGMPAVYLVEPQGPIGEINPDTGTSVFYAPYAKVRRKINPEELRKKKKKKVDTSGVLG